MEVDPSLRLIRQRIVLEQRAAYIGDPIERLRFLRREMRHGLNARNALRISFRWLARQHAWGMALLLVMSVGYTASRVQGVPEIRPTILPPPLQIPSPLITNPSPVWLVARKEGVEIYSNGLRINGRFEASNLPRGSYRVFSRAQTDVRHAQMQSGPSGIVFHTTESMLAPFQAEQNKTIQKISVEVMNFVRENHSYHYLIDRFGGVFRIVKESDVAYHAGHSVWADENKVYVNLNTAFLGVAFETQTQTGSSIPTATPAQIDAARVLTELLRQRYHIAVENCVTHAQVSVNPINHRIGFHTDWADKFPFLEIGLRDNYQQPPASLFAFGFEYDPGFVASTGARLLPGLLQAEGQVASRAAELNQTISQYKTTLQKNYREITGDAPTGETSKENTNEK